MYMVVHACTNDWNVSDDRPQAVRMPCAGYHGFVVMQWHQPGPMFGTENSSWNISMVCIDGLPDRWQANTVTAGGFHAIALSGERSSLGHQNLHLSAERLWKLCKVDCVLQLTKSASG